MLIEMPGIDVNSFDKFGQTALYYASIRGHTEIAEMLIKR